MNTDNYADRLIRALKEKATPCIVGLDPRLDAMPNFVWQGTSARSDAERIRTAISRFHGIVLDHIQDLVPAVKPQIAFYEQYGIGGLLGFLDTLEMAKKRRLMVIVDAKRNDIASTAEAYANAFLGRTKVPWGTVTAWDVDCITISPFLGRDSLVPFIGACKEYGKGVFILVKTSNPGSADCQDLAAASNNRPIYELLARLVDELATEAVGREGYSSIGAVVGATFPQQARNLRRLMPRSFFLVPGYGAQGGTAEGAAACFNGDGCGAVVNASRSITYAFGAPGISEEDFGRRIAANTRAMIEDLRSVIPPLASP
jgi:orotidine-5'-phosphate decarboxylase